MTQNEAIKLAIAALETVVKSAYPHPIEHPTMTAAWDVAHHAIVALRALPPDDWQSIATAPKDEWGVLAWMPTYYGGRGAVVKAVWMQGAWYDNRASIIQPTHWRPRPAPPKEQK